MVITHDASLARAISGRILVMEAGRIVKDLGPERFGELASMEDRRE
jgi:ABC-type glutathione transport system ATPase component